MTEKVGEIKSSAFTDLWTEVSERRCRIKKKKKKEGAEPIEHGKTIKKYIESRKKKRNHS